MLRIRVSLPKQNLVHYRHLDLLHDALINAWTAAGATIKQVYGASAFPWNFAALGKTGHIDKIVHTLIVSTPAPTLTKYLRDFKPQDIHYARASTIEVVDFAEAKITLEDDPICPQQNALGVLLLSPLAIRDNTVAGSKRWHKHLGQFDLSAAINHRLSRLAERDIQLQVHPDSLYVRWNPDHAVLVPVKEMPNGKKAFVIGMSAPLVLQGSDVDLRFAWYAGLGEKTRNGFGCIGLAEEGVGR
jgi:CRISPR-associated endoribonuclease Cas6